MNRHRRARYWRLIDRINSSVGWLAEPVFAVLLVIAFVNLILAFLDAAMRRGPL